MKHNDGKPNMDEDILYKWFQHLATYSKMSFDNDTRKIYYEGKEVEGVEIPLLREKELSDIFECRLGSQARKDLMDRLTEVLGLTDLERKQARYKMAFTMRMNGETHRLIPIEKGMKYRKIL